MGWEAPLFPHMESLRGRPTAQAGMGRWRHCKSVRPQPKPSRGHRRKLQTKPTKSRWPHARTSQSPFLPFLLSSYSPWASFQTRVCCFEIPERKEINLKLASYLALGKSQGTKGNEDSSLKLYHPKFFFPPEFFQVHILWGSTPSEIGIDWLGQSRQKNKPNDLAPKLKFWTESSAWLKFFELSLSFHL